MPPIQDAGTLRVLSISPLEEDHSSLQSIIAHTRWKLLKTGSPSVAFPILRRADISVIVCEQDLGMVKWTALLDHLNKFPHPPSLIVTSRLADDRFWAEALNLGAWDVLAKPFDRTEVLRTVRAAWQHWHHRTSVRAEGILRAAS